MLVTNTLESTRIRHLDYPVLGSIGGPLAEFREMSILALEARQLA